MNLDNIYEQIENFNYLKAKMRDEGFHYCFKHYSSFKEIKDEEFHKLRKQYIEISNKLEKYVDEKIISLHEKLDIDE
jgi:hypothetical protein